MTDKLETTALVIHDTRVVTPDVIEKAKVLAQRTSRFLGMSEPVAEATFLKGWELGFKMTAAPEFIQVIQGKPTLSPRGHLALLHNSGIFRGDGYLKVQEIYKDDKYIGAYVAMKRGDSNVEYETRFTMEDATRAKLIKADSGWEKYPQNMCRWRAIGYCADVVAPDIGGGMKRADELGADITPDGDVIPGSWRVVQNNGIDFNTAYSKLENQFAPIYGDKIKNVIAEANDGRWPHTVEELREIWKVLEADAKSETQEVEVTE